MPQWIDNIKNHKFFSRIEDQPTPPQVYNYRIWMTAMIATLAAMAVGYDQGFIGGATSLDLFKEEFGFNNMSKSHASDVHANIVSLFHAGCFFGSLFSYPVSYFMGRKPGLQVSAVLIFVGSVIMMAASGERGLSPIYIGRVIAGLGVGITTNLVPVYIAEISPPAIRGQIVGLYEMSWRNGDLVGFWINYGVSINLPANRTQWMIPFGIQIVPAALFLAGLLILHELPRWLIGQGRHNEAIDNLVWLRQLPEDHEYIVYEVNQAQEAITEQQNAVGTDFWAPAREVFHSKKLLLRLNTTMWLFVFQNFMGVQCINYYSPVIFKSLGVTGTNATLFSTGFIGVVKYVSTILWILFVVDNYGRRNTLMICSGVCSLCFWYIGAYIKIVAPETNPNGGGPGGQAALGFIYIWVFFFIMAWSGTPYVIGAEVFDTNVRTFVSLFNALANWLSIFLMSRFSPNMINTMGYGIYFFFAAIAIAAIPFVFFLVPETKGIRLEDMDRLFALDLPAWRAHKVVLAQVRAEGQDIQDDLHSLAKLDTANSDKAKVETLERVDTEDRTA